MQKTGKGHSQISAALKTLIEKHQIIEAYDDKGNRLDTSSKRRAAFGRIYYRLDLRSPQPTLFSKNHRVRKSDTGHRSRFSATQKLDTTKETVLTKETIINHADGKPPAQPKKIPLTERNEKTPTKPTQHHALVEFWHATAKDARRIDPIVTKADARNLKRILDLGIEPDTIRKAAIFFLYDRSFRTFSPSISTFLSAGVLNGIINRMTNDPEFWRQIDPYFTRVKMANQIATPDTPADQAKTIAELAKLKARLAVFLGNSARTEAQMEVAAQQRADRRS